MAEEVIEYLCCPVCKRENLRRERVRKGMLVLSDFYSCPECGTTNIPYKEMLWLTEGEAKFG